MSSGDVIVDVADLTVVGIWTVAEVSLALVVLHVAASRSLPAYSSKNYGLSLLTAMAVSCPLVSSLSDGLRGALRAEGGS